MIIGVHRLLPAILGAYLGAHFLSLQGDAPTCLLRWRLPWNYL